MRSAGLNELQAGIKIGGRNINSLRYVDDTILMSEREEELNSFLMRVKKESERASLKLNIKKTKIMASGPTVLCLVSQLCPTLCGPMGHSSQAPLSLGFSRQEYWSRLPSPPPGDLSNPAIKHRSHTAGGFLTV